MGGRRAASRKTGKRSKILTPASPEALRSWKDLKHMQHSEHVMLKLPNWGILTAFFIIIK